MPAASRVLVCWVAVPALRREVSWSLAGAVGRGPMPERPQSAAWPGPPLEVRHERAACRVRPMLRRSTRSHRSVTPCSTLPDARAIADELTARRISLSLGGSVYDPTDAVGRLLFNVLAMVAESSPTSSGFAPARA
jgi:hypothetical protein